MNIEDENLDSTKQRDRLILHIMIFFVNAGIIHIVSWLIPDMKINLSRANTTREEEHPRTLWVRGDSYNTDWISMQNYFTYTLLNVMGFAYVQLATLSRDKWWTGFDGNKFDFYIKDWMSLAKMNFCYQTLGLSGDAF